MEVVEDENETNTAQRRIEGDDREGDGQGQGKGGQGNEEATETKKEKEAAQRRKGGMHREGGRVEAAEELSLKN